MMSFLGHKKIIDDQDLGILYISHNNMVPLKVCRGQVTQTKYGAIRHSDIIGKKFGCRIMTTNGKGWVVLLQPTPELWTLTLPHRTQILYFADISLITLKLDLKPGSRVAEAGTGSGSLSHAIARTIVPTGHLYTYEFHEQRAKQAREEFESHGLSKVVTLSHRDVIKDGFDDSITVDAVFLDLPSPWLVVPHAKKVLTSSGGRICSFSPCIEQVQKTCTALSELGFSELETVECLLRPFDVKYSSLPESDLGVPAKKTDSETEDSDNGKTEGNAKATKECHSSDKFQNEGEADDDEIAAKRAKLEENALPKCIQRRKNPQSYSRCVVPQREITGHTGYLTFASLYEFKT